MIARSIRQCSEVMDAVMRGPIPGNLRVNRVCIDSREATNGSLFFALPGTRTHGIEFADQAAAQGAIVVTDERSADRAATSLLVVADVRQALQQLANANRLQSSALVTGITGSVGKTTARRLLSAVLSSSHHGVESPANYNNELGVPLSLLQIQDDTEFAAIELGATCRGDIAGLCQIAQPEFGIVTRVAPAHLAHFESIDTIAATKCELIQSLPADGVAILNADDPYVAAMELMADCRVVTVGQTPEATLRYSLVDTSNYHVSIQIDSAQYRTPICGTHHGSLIAIAVAAGLEIGMSPDWIQQGLESFGPAPGRMDPQRIRGIEVIDDTYNASPASVEAAVQLLQNWQTQGRRLMVLGDMLDLGLHAAAQHVAAGKLMAHSRLDHVAALGRHATDVADGFIAAGGAISRISVFDDESTLLSVLDCLVDAGDVLLVKGSRGMATERIIDRLNGKQSNSMRRAA